MPPPPRGPSGVLWDPDAAEAWARLLGEVPTTFGKLVQVASYREEGSGRYSHPQLQRVFADAVIDSVLRASHDELFGEWLNYSLEQQRDEVVEYLASLRGAQGQDRTMIETSVRLIPASAGAAQRKLFLSDMEITLKLTEL